MKDPLVNVHPHAIETYVVLEGEMEFFVKDKWVTAKKGEKLSVPKGVAHTFRNPTQKIVTVYKWGCLFIKIPVRLRRTSAFPYYSRPFNLRA